MAPGQESLYQIHDSQGSTIPRRMVFDWSCSCQNVHCLGCHSRHRHGILAQCDAPTGLVHSQLGNRQKIGFGGASIDDSIFHHVDSDCGILQIGRGDGISPYCCLWCGARDGCRSTLWSILYQESIAAGGALFPHFWGVYPHPVGICPSEGWILDLPIGAQEFQDFGPVACALYPLFYDKLPSDIWDASVEPCNSRYFEDYTGMDSLLSFATSAIATGAIAVNSGGRVWLESRNSILDDAWWDYVPHFYAIIHFEILMGRQPARWLPPVRDRHEFARGFNSGQYGNSVCSVSGTNLTLNYPHMNTIYRLMAVPDTCLSCIDRAADRDDTKFTTGRL